MRNKRLSFLIRECVVEVLVEAGLTESFRGFNLAHFKNLPSAHEMIKYADEHLPMLGEGGTRTTYGWKAGKVIKILASFEDDHQQTRNEIAVYTKPGMAEFLAPIIDYDDENYYWLIVEGVKVFSDNADLMAKLTPSERLLEVISRSRHEGFSLEEALRLGIESHNMHWKRTHSLDTNTKHTVGRDLSMEDFTALDMELFRKMHEATALGIADIARYDHWGLSVSGKVVIVDYGIVTSGLKV